MELIAKLASLESTTEKPSLRNKLLITFIRNSQEVLVNMLELSDTLNLSTQRETKPEISLSTKLLEPVFHLSSSQL